jgi:hypothetical protein
VAAIRDAAVAGAVASILSGIPSTAHALLTGDDPFEPSLAAGTLLLPRESRRAWLLPAAAAVHVGLSFGWAVVLTMTLPKRRTIAAAPLAGLGIAALDLGVVGRRVPRIRALPLAPQIADHVAYATVVAVVLARRRARAGRSPTPGKPRP